MPYKKINKIDIYYELHGHIDAFPLVMFEGWGVSMWAWFRQLPTFSEYYRVLTFDNRGVGKTSKPDEPYSIELFASDAKGLLDSLGIKKAHIFGNSMGGYIAQQFAISYPETVSGLVLASTRFGGGYRSNAIMPSNEITTKMFAVPTETISQEQATAIKRSTAWSESFLRENQNLLIQMDAWINENPQPLFALARQTEAALDFDVEKKLDKITCPTLILHGENDLVVPPENAELLLNKINLSRLILFRGSPHRIEVERYKDFNQAILTFLKEVDEGKYKPDPKKIVI